MHLGCITVTQPQSVRQRKVTERGFRVHKSHQCSTSVHWLFPAVQPFSFCKTTTENKITRFCLEFTCEILYFCCAYCQLQATDVSYHWDQNWVSTGAALTQEVEWFVQSVCQSVYAGEALNDKLPPLHSSLFVCVHDWK